MRSPQTGLVSRLVSPWHRAAFSVGVALFIFTACAPDVGELDESPPLTPADIASRVVVAQFDPTNPIPQLRLVPSPTALAQNEDGTINQDAVRPAPCELPDRAQCLQLTERWPVNLFPTLSFSGRLTGTSTAAGLKLFAVRTATAADRAPVVTLEEVPVTVEQMARERPPEACQMGNNGTDPPLTFTGEDVDAAWGPNPTDVTLRPVSGRLEPETQYVVMATRALRGVPVDGGMPRPVEASDTFYLLNQDTVAPSAAAAPLKAFIDRTVGLLLQTGVIGSRSEVVIANTWTTGGGERPPTEVVFDPAGSTFPTDVRFPLPNDPLLTAPSTVAEGAGRVRFPTEGLSPTLAAVVMGLNELDGFGLTTPIVMQTSQALDPASLEGNVIMVELGPTQMPTGNRPRVAAVARPGTADAPPQLILQPLEPLNPSTTYAIGVTTGVRDVDRQPIQASDTFELLKTPSPIIQNGTVNESLLPILQCATIERTGAFNPDAVPALATQLEQDLARPRWQVAFRALEALSPSITRDQLAMAFTYTTQSVTDTVDGVKAALEGYEPAGAPRLVATPVDVTGSSSIAAVIDVTGNLCLPICQTGALEPEIPREQCDARRAEVAASAPCQTLSTLFTSALGRVQLLLLQSYELTEGNPLVTGEGAFPEVVSRQPAAAEPRVVRLPVWVVTPAGSPPAMGWPIAIFQHGLGLGKEVGLLIANTLAQEGWATVSLDLPFHGDRASDIVNNETGLTCTAVDPEMVTCTLGTETCTGGCDGLRDPSGTGFLSPNVFALRDNLRQATVDHLTLLRTLEIEAGSGLLADLDAAQIGVIGTSLGGIAAANLAAYVTPDEVRAFALNGAGGGLIEILRNTIPLVSAGLYRGLAAAGVCELVEPDNPAAGCENTALFETFLILAQWVTEPGDPLATSVGVVRSLPMRPPPFGADGILMQVSRPDPVIPNPASARLGTAYGFDLENSDNYRVYDFRTFPEAMVGTGCHLFLFSPSCGACFQDNLCYTFGAQRQAALWIDSGGAPAASPRPETLLGGMINCSAPCGE